MVTDKTSYYYRKPICSNCTHWGANTAANMNIMAWNAVCEESPTNQKVRPWDYTCEKCKVIK